MLRLPTPLRRAAVVLAPAIAGVIAITGFVANREGLPETGTEPPAKAVRVVQAKAVPARPRARGHGTVQPARTWQGVAEVAGRIVHEHPDLARGSTIPKGATLLKIEPTQPRLRVDELEARIANLQAQLDELATTADNLDASIAIQRRATELARQNFERAKTLSERGAVPESTRDSREEAFLAQRRQLQDLKNERRLLPSKRKQLEASLAERKAALARANDDLESTTLTAPFTMRLSEVRVEEGQYVAAGTRLVAGDGTAAAEIAAAVSIDRLRAVLESAGLTGSQGIARLNARLKRADLTARIRLKSGDTAASWTGRVVRLGDGLNSTTRTVPVIVQVNEPYASGPHPLVKNMYVEVDVRGRSESRVVIPRAALHDGNVYAVSGNTELRMQAVEVAYRLGDTVALDGGLAEGTPVVVDDLVPAVEGMRLDPTRMPELEQRLAETAAGGETVR